MTDTLRKAAEELIEAWDWDCSEPRNIVLRDLIEDIRQALKQPEQEPVTWGMRRKDGVIIDVICPEEHSKEPGDYTTPLYTAPPKREWVGLTDEDLVSCLPGAVRIPPGWRETSRAIEAKLKEKNNG